MSDSANRASASGWGMTFSKLWSARTARGEREASGTGRDPSGGSEMAGMWAGQRSPRLRPAQATPQRGSPGGALRGALAGGSCGPLPAARYRATVPGPR
eukprot:10723494-Alexandrium_andersonii.AAC.1